MDRIVLKTKKQRFWTSRIPKIPTFRAPTFDTPNSSLPSIAYALRSDHPPSPRDGCPPVNYSLLLTSFGCWDVEDFLTATNPDLTLRRGYRGGTSGSPPGWGGNQDETTNMTQRIIDAKHDTIT